MVPKIAAKGASFKGAAAYYLHDKEADTSERVEWSETRNLATDDPEVAWRIMAATAMCQDRLKEAAGIPATGRKSNNAVMTYSIAWHPDEKPHLTKDEMLQAAHDSLEALGAQDHQALFVCHNDEPHPHVHIMVNRVSPSDGRMLSSSKEKLKLSRWAQDYEEMRGKIWCEERVKNNHAREVLGQFTRAAKDRPRHILEIETQAQVASKRRPEEAKALVQSEKEKDLALSQKGRDLQDRHREQWDDLSAAHKDRKKRITREVKLRQNTVKAKIEERNAPVKETMQTRHKAEHRLFDRRETRLMGRVRNILDGVRDRAVDGEARTNFLGRSFRMIASKKARHDALEKRQRREGRLIANKEARQIEKAQGRIGKVGMKLKDRNLARFYRDRQDIKLRQSMDNAKLKAEWKQRGADRKKAWREFRVGQFLTKHGVGRPGMQRDRTRGFEP